MKRNYQKLFAVAVCCTICVCAVNNVFAKPKPKSSSDKKTAVQKDQSAGIVEKSYDMASLSIAATGGAEASADGKSVNVTFERQWGQLAFAVPAGIDMQQVTNVTVKTAPGADNSNLCIKVLKEDGLPNFVESLVNYSGLSIQITNPVGLKYIGLMNMIEAKRSVAFESITFTVDLSRKPVTSIEQNIKPWKSVITKAFGSNTIAGASIMYNELNDKFLMDLVHKHFNAVTFGNELKPDAMLGGDAPGANVVTATIDGKNVIVPAKLNMAGSNAEKLLKVIKSWNDKNPKDKIRVRGHVLVWHSQTPEWFFHEDYNIKKPYADPATMTLRQEWYIKNVLEYFAGSDSEFKDLFYGWDVVNEAVSDSSGSYRTDKESSSWWAVYKSNEFIVNAFRFANKYAPKSIDLYYNDYNETSLQKTNGIVQLLKDVKSCPDARIDGFGMQGHYKTDSFNAVQFEESARAYAAVVGKIMLTELDFQSSTGFSGLPADREIEITKMAYCHKEIFDVYKKLSAEKNINVGGITFWGVIEPNSWLHAFANVGGGADGKTKQCPLMFDASYKAKPAYWAYVDSSKLEPNIQNIVIEKADDVSISSAKSFYEINGAGVKVKFIPFWNEDGVSVVYEVEDKASDAKDGVTVFVDAAGSFKDKSKVQTAAQKRSDASKTTGGYKGRIFVPAKNLSVSSVIAIDVRVSNGSKLASFNNASNTQEQGSKYFAKALLKPSTFSINKGSVKIDGEIDSAWQNVPEIQLGINLGADASAYAKTMYDKDYLYALVVVSDSSLDDTNANAWEQDSVEIFIDENNHKSSAYEADDKQYRINYKNVQSFNGSKCNAGNVISCAKVSGKGYVIEAAFKWTDIKPVSGTQIGIEFQINDSKNGARLGTLSWFDHTGQGYASPAVFGTAELK